MVLRYYGSLKKIVSIPADFDLEAPISIDGLLELLNIPKSSVKLVMINHSPALPRSTIQPTDSIALFPREYPFFADWKDYRWE